MYSHISRSSTISSPAQFTIVAGTVAAAITADPHALARADRWDDAFAALLRNIPESEARVFLGRVLIDAGRPTEAALRRLFPFYD